MSLDYLPEHAGEKLIPRFAVLLGGAPKSLLDNLAYAEKLGWIDNAEEFIGTRKLRNLLVHEYFQKFRNAFSFYINGLRPIT